MKSFLQAIQATLTQLPQAVEKAATGLLTKVYEWHFSHDKTITTQIWLINQAIRALQTGLDERQTLEELFSDIPCLTTDRRLQQLEQQLFAGSQAPFFEHRETLRKQLIAALKAHKTSYFLLRDGVQKNNELRKLSGKFLSASHVADSFEAVTKKSEEQLILIMEPLAAVPWQPYTATKGLVKVPDELLHCPSENNRSVVITTGGKRFDKEDSSWTDAIGYVGSTLLGMPLKGMQAEDLRSIFNQLQSFLQRTLQGRKDHFVFNNCLMTPAINTKESLLSDFFAKLVRYLNDDRFHPFQVAAFVHHNLTRIRPIHEGSERLARLFMNLYLMQKGVQPLIIEDELVYRSLLHATDPIRAFAEYLYRQRMNSSYT